MNKSTKNSLNRFSNRVNNYTKYRPSYPKDVIKFFHEKLELNSTDIIADIGSGTGIFSELLLKNGNTVYGIEPNNEMREAAENKLKSNKNFISVSATAENTLLENNCIDFITCAQSFHWFNWENTQKEFIRILRNNGWVVLVWNSRINDASEFMLSYEEFTTNFSTDYKKVNHKNINEENFKHFFKQYDVHNFPNQQKLDFEGLKGRVLSASYMPAESDKTYKKMEIELEKLFNKYENNGFIKLIYQTEVYYGRLA